MKKAYIVEAKRTPVGKARGCFARTRADDLLIHAIQSVLSAADSTQQVNNNIDDNCCWVCNARGTSRAERCAYFYFTGRPS